MGRAIVYCGDCGKSLTDEDFAKGRARIIDNVPFCIACRPLPAAPPAVPPPTKISTTRIPVRPPSTRRMATAPARKPAPRVLIGLGLGIAALLTLTLLLALPRGSPPPPFPPPPSSPPVPAPSPAPPRPLAEPRIPPDSRSSEEAARFDRFLEEIRRMIRDPARLPDRQAEVEGMLASAEKIAGTRLVEIRTLRAEFAKALEEARLRREREERLEEILLTLQEALQNGRALRKRKDEVERLLQEAARLAGPRAGEIETLRNQFAQALEQAQRFRGLVGHWRLDGDAKDSGSGGFHGTLSGTPSSSEGRVGGALRFASDDQFIILPASAELNRLQEDSYTLTLWFRAEALPEGKGGEDTYSRHGLLIKAGWHLGLSYDRSGHFFMDHWLEGNKNVGVASDKTFPPGEWHHLAGVVDVNAGATLIYIDGRQAGRRTWPAGKPARSYGRAPWRIGQANPGAPKYAWPARGWIDDVRLYDQALTPEEIQTLYQAGAGGRDP